MTRYADLSSVAWVNSWWAGAVFLFMLALVLIPALSTADAVGVPLLVLILASVLLFSYPYIHYRINGGAVQRIPPRFVTDKKFMSKDYL